MRVFLILGLLVLSGCIVSTEVSEFENSNSDKEDSDQEYYNKEPGPGSCQTAFEYIEVNGQYVKISLPCSEGPFPEQPEDIRTEENDMLDLLADPVQESIENHE